MFHKFNKQIFHRTLQNVKHHIGNGYHHLKNVAGAIDHGVHIAKQVYSVLEPVIRHAVGNDHIHSHAMKAISGYENIRNKVADANHHIANVGHKLNGII